MNLNTLIRKILENLEKQVAPSCKVLICRLMFHFIKTLPNHVQSSHEVGFLANAKVISRLDNCNSLLPRRFRVQEVAGLYIILQGSHFIFYVFTHQPIIKINPLRQ